MLEIIICPEELWDFCDDHRDELSDTMFVVARDEELGAELYVTEREEFPFLVIEHNGIEILNEGIVNSNDSFETCMFMLDEMSPRRLGSSYNETATAVSVNADSRELELEDAVRDFLITVSGAIIDDDTLIGVMDDLLEYVNDLGFPVYRPTVFQLESGNSVTVDFPYDDY